MSKTYFLFLQKCTAGDLDVIKQELSSNVNLEGYISDGWAVASAAAKGHLDVVQFFFEKYGKDVCNQPYSLTSSTKNGYMDVVKYLIETCKQDPDLNDGEPLRGAASYGRLDIVKYLIKECDVKNLNEALFLSAVEGEVSVVKYLIKNGADYTNFQAEIPYQDAEKYTQACDFCEKVVQGVILEPAEYLFQNNLKMLKNTRKKNAVRRRPKAPTPPKL